MSPDTANCPLGEGSKPPLIENDCHRLLSVTFTDEVNFILNFGGKSIQGEEKVAFIHR